MAATMSLRPGDSFGRYELVSRLGYGGMAETWRAKLLGAAGVTKPVLIKKILAAYADNEAFISMFITEARISATLSHGNIAQVYDFGKVGDEYFLAMEYVDGKQLDRIVKRAQRFGLFALPPQLATFIALEMCRGLHYAHTRKDENGKPLGLVHRDIAPDNVLLSYEGQVKIVDFGIAKAKASALRSMTTAPGVVKGKYLFFSPEQARGEQVDARTDVWATGIVLYELLSGRLPAEGPEHAVIPRLINGEFPRPSDLRPDLPAELDDITMRALALRRGERFQSSHEFGEALAGFLYSSWPRFSTMSLSYFVQELFREDLTSEGRGVNVPDAFLEEMGRWKIPPTSVQGDKTHELKAVAPKVAVSSEDPDKTQPSRQKIAARGALKPSPRALAVKARPPDDDDDEGDETRPQPLDDEDGIETAETMRFPPQKSNAGEALESRPSQTDSTQPTPPAVFEARRKERFWSYSLKALTLIAVAAIVIAIVMMRQEPLQATVDKAGSEPESSQLLGKSARDMAEEASRLIEQRRYPEASEVLARCLQLEPANSECRQLQQKASNSSP
jgi:eukaryotic-like serine/threonine-protein kinase